MFEQSRRIVKRRKKLYLTPNIQYITYQIQNISTVGIMFKYTGLPTLKLFQRDTALAGKKQD